MAALKLKIFRVLLQIRIFHKISNLGVDKLLPIETRKRIRIVNQVSILNLMLGLIMILYTLYFGLEQEVVYLALLITISLFIPFILNYKGKILASRLSLMLLYYAIISSLSILFGEDFHFQYYLLICLGMPLLFFEYNVRVLKWLLAFIAIPLWMILEWYLIDSTPIFNINKDISLKIRFINDFLIFLIIMLQIVLTVTQNRLQFREIEDKRKKLKKSNRALKESIDYSRKIQFSILPPRDVINKSIPNTFVYFQPKEVISGDFYWFYKNEKFSYIASVDCTGHGVPGGLMSMTVHSILNEIMHDNKVDEPSQILSVLHQKIFKNLRQSKGDEYSQDGCDISLCRIDYKSNKLMFSGAHSDLFICTEKGTEIFKSTRKSIGGLSMLGECEPDRSFENIQMTIPEKSLFILTTDGIIDQLNENNEAFGINQFGKMLSQLFIESTNAREEYVNSQITKWLKNTDQLDDLLIIGIQF